MNTHTRAREIELKKSSRAEEFSLGREIIRAGKTYRVPLRSKDTLVRYVTAYLTMKINTQMRRLLANSRLPTGSKLQSNDVSVYARYKREEGRGRMREEGGGRRKVVEKPRSSFDDNNSFNIAALCAHFGKENCEIFQRSHGDYLALFFT